MRTEEKGRRRFSELRAIGHRHSAPSLRSLTGPLCVPHWNPFLPPCTKGKSLIETRKIAWLTETVSQAHQHASATARIGLSLNYVATVLKDRERFLSICLSFYQNLPEKLKLIRLVRKIVQSSSVDRVNFIADDII